MKKLVLLLAVVFMYSCDSEEGGGFLDFDNIDYDTGIDPPKWILGTWIDAKGKEIIFSKSDIVVDPAGNRYTAKGEISYYLSKNEDPELVQIKTDTSYTLQFKESASSRRNFKFIKISDTKIESKGIYKGIYSKK